MLRIRGEFIGNVTRITDSISGDFLAGQALRAPTKIYSVASFNGGPANILLVHLPEVYISGKEKKEHMLSLIRSFHFQWS